jgi:hypothetical protein
MPTNEALIATLRTNIYAYIGYRGGASDQEVADAGITWGGKAAEFADELLELIGR